MVARYHTRIPRLYVEAALAAGMKVSLDARAANYLLNVLRLGANDSVLLFNGHDGEWRAKIAPGAKRAVVLALIERTRAQTIPRDLTFLFAPLKHARLDYMVQKAVELGASRLQPVLTFHTQAARVKLDRMRANAIEAAEQCGILSLPEVCAPIALAQLVGAWSPSRLLVFCDEDAETADPLAALAAMRVPGTHAALPVSVLIGPEGGFAEPERAALMRLANVVRISLGPRILRADTAAIAALTLVQAVLGDWR
jgi:16S rRNA (uracil1498-N3)-methyltransferase